IIYSKMDNNNNNINENDIAIIGVGMRFPGGADACIKNADQLWSKLKNGEDCLSQLQPTRLAKSYYDQELITNCAGGFLPDEEWRTFDPTFFGITKMETEQIDPQIRLLMTVVWESIEDAQLKYETVRGSNTAVFIGTMTQGYKQIVNSEITDMDPYSLAGNILTFMSNRLSYAFDFRGPSLTLDTACSSSLNAALLGCQAIRSGASEMAIVGGVNDLLECSPTILLSSIGALSKTGKCHSFDASADGYVRAEGAGVCLLKRYSSAVKDGNRIYAVIKGGSTNVDGFNDKSSLTAPSGTAQAENVKFALKDAASLASDIFYVEAHGTGTPVGDPTEVGALAKVFSETRKSDDPLNIGSIKSNMGHLEAAAGVASLIKVSLMLKNRMLMPSINFNQANPSIKMDEWKVRVVTQPTPLPKDRVIKMGINCFGLGGSNCHLILEEHVPTKSPLHQSKMVQTQTQVIESVPRQYLIPFSGNSKVSVDKYIESMRLDVDLQAKVPFDQFVRHQIESKSHFPSNRRVLVAQSWEQLSDQSTPMQQFSASSTPSTLASFSRKQSHPIVFVFCGQGPQWTGMGLELYNNSPVFKAAVDQCDSMMAKHFHYSILNTIRTLPDDRAADIHHPILAQPSIFLIQVGLVALYNHWGIRPSIVVGHSFGEVTAALCANFISLETACMIVYHRATLQNSTIGSGRMLSVGIGEVAYNKDYSARYPTLEIACYNSPDSIVLTGDEADLMAITQELKAQSVFAIMLTTPCSFHSSKQESIRQKVMETADLQEINYMDNDENGAVYFSTVTGEVMTNKQDYNVKYIFDNLREPVHFNKAITNIYAHIAENKLGTSPVFLEIAPHPTLAFYIKKAVPVPSAFNNIKFNPLVVSSLHRKDGDVETLHKTLTSVYFHGVDIDFSCQLKVAATSNWQETTSCIPGYQWDANQYWTEPLRSKKTRLEGPTNNHLGHRIQSSNAGGISYLALIDVAKRPFAFLKGHKIKGQSLFPGTGYVDNILRAFRDRDVYIHSLDFKYPFFLKEGTFNHLQTNFIELDNKSVFRVEFLIRENHNTEEWTRSALGRISVHQPMQPHQVPKVNVAALRAKCNLATLTHEQVYQKIRPSGIEFGESFSRMKSAAMGKDCCLSTIMVNPPVSEYDVDTFFNTPILDSCAQGLIALINPTELVFEGVSGMKVYNCNLPKTRPEHIYVFVRLLTNSGNTCTGDCQVFLEDGTLLMQGERMVCHYLKRTKDIVPKNPSKYLFQQQWQPKELSRMVTGTTGASVSQLLGDTLASVSKTSSSPCIFKILDLTDQTQQIELLETAHQSIKLNQSISIEYSIPTIDGQPLDLGLSTIQERYLPASFDLIITNNQLVDQDLSTLLTPSGQLVTITPNLKITQRPRIDQLPAVKDVDRIVFVIACSDNPAVKELECHFTEQGLLSSNKIEVFKSCHFIDEATATLSEQQLIKFIGGGGEDSQAPSKCSIIFLAGLEPLGSDNYLKRTMEYVRINQILLRNRVTNTNVVLTTMGTQDQSSNYFNSSLVGIFRYFLEFQDSFSSVFVDRVTLDYLLQLSRFDQLNEREYSLRLDTNNLVVPYICKIIPKLVASCSAPDRGEADQALYSKLNKQLELEFRPRMQVANGQVEVKVMASGVRSKDRLFADPNVSQDLMLSGHVYDPPFGFEFSGVITSTSSTCSRFKVGDEVLGLGFASLASHVVVNEEWIVAKPRNLTFAQAASFPVDYLTSYIATYVQGYLDGDDSVLIIANDDVNASVGRATLNLLQQSKHTGKVTQQHAQSLKHQYGAMLTDVFVCDQDKSQQHNIAGTYSDVISARGGVNLVINTGSGSGSSLKSTFDCLGQCGRIIDLSTSNSVDNDNISCKQFQQPHGYTSFNLEQLAINKPKLIQRYLGQLTRMFEQQQLSIDSTQLPITVFPVSDIKLAFQPINGQMGKVVVDFSTSSTNTTSSNYTRMMDSMQGLHNIGETLLITGQTGIAIVILRWILDNKPKMLRDVIVLSRSSLKWELEYMINSNLAANAGINIHYRSVDISDISATRSIIQQLYIAHPLMAKVSSVIHFAAMYNYSEVQSISKDSLAMTHQPKAVGAHNLHTLSLEFKWDLKNFILFSSIFGVIGSSNQSSYVSSNAVMDGLARHRRAQGLAAISVNWGALDGGGEVVNNPAVSKFLRSIGFDLLSVSNILGGMQMFLNNRMSLPQVMLGPLNFKPMFQMYPHMRIVMEYLSKVEDIIQSSKGLSLSCSEDGANGIFDMISKKVTDLLSMDKLDNNVSLKDYGVDSLLTVQLKNWIQREFKVNSFSTQQIASSSINSLVQSIESAQSQ
ncbi:hypothetical protein SAMD00019534_099010, partial [Acytostelium subglobosum LB1]|uniref:hypothetical protein n=1 Tax=Acytostelium subglobosum LB1 TaxID=1410327 RepID=UPI000644FE47